MLRWRWRGPGLAVELRIQIPTESEFSNFDGQEGSRHTTSLATRSANANKTWEAGGNTRTALDPCSRIEANISAMNPSIASKSNRAPALVILSRGFHLPCS